MPWFAQARFPKLDESGGSDSQQFVRFEQLGQERARILLFGFHALACSPLTEELPVTMINDCYFGGRHGNMRTGSAHPLADAEGGSFQAFGLAQNLCLTTTR